MPKVVVKLDEASFLFPQAIDSGIAQRGQVARYLVEEFTGYLRTHRAYGAAYVIATQHVSQIQESLPKIPLIQIALGQTHHEERRRAADHLGLTEAQAARLARLGPGEAYYRGPDASVARRIQITRAPTLPAVNDHDVRAWASRRADIREAEADRYDELLTLHQHALLACSLELQQLRRKLQGAKRAHLLIGDPATAPKAERLHGELRLITRHTRERIEALQRRVQQDWSRPLESPPTWLLESTRRRRKQDPERLRHEGLQSRHARLRNAYGRFFVRAKSAEAALAALA